VRVRLTISRKFFAVLAAMGALTIAVALAGVAGLASVRSELDRVSRDNVRVSQASTTLGSNLSRADQIALRLASDTNRGERRGLNAILDQSVVPGVNDALAELRSLHAHDGPSERALVARLARGWSEFVALRDSGVLGTQRSVTEVVAGSDRLARRISGIFDPLTAITQSQVALEASQSAQAYVHAVDAYNTSLLVIGAIALGALALGLGSMLVLTRNVVPRIRRYSEFATAVAGGDLGGRLTPRGSDELATLGRALNEMVERRSVSVTHQHVQGEFVDALQVTDTEEVAHDLLRRQVERSIPGSSVVVLNRNNSENRLEATTIVPDGSTLKQTLIDAKPRSCMAVLFARPHSEGRCSRTSATSRSHRPAHSPTASPAFPIDAR
jgi:HAMP domain-containing protein